MPPSPTYPPPSAAPEGAAVSRGWRDGPTLLADYARYHRDPRNIATHFIGIPLTIFALGNLLSRPAWTVVEISGWGVPLTPAWLLWCIVSLWCLTRGLPGLGLVVSGFNAVLVSLGALMASSHWLWGVLAFAMGWMFQSIGHYYEGRKPAFTEDLLSLFVGSMFIVAEWLFGAGLLNALRNQIEHQVGPRSLRNLAHPMA